MDSIERQFRWSRYLPLFLGGAGTFLLGVVCRSEWLIISSLWLFLAGGLFFPVETNWVGYIHKSSVSPFGKTSRIVRRSESPLRFRLELTYLWAIWLSFCAWLSYETLTHRWTDVAP
jgi:hypothetical protein